MNRYTVENVRVIITWKSGSKTRTTIPFTELIDHIALYTEHGPMSAIRKITVKEAN